MSDVERQRSPDVTAVTLEAVSSPVRLGIYTWLRAFGARKASTLARRMGIGETNTLRNLRILQDAGFVATDDDALPERQRVWRHVPGGIRLTSLVGSGNADSQMMRRWMQGYIVNQGQLHREWADEYTSWSAEWQNASMNMGYWLRLSPEELEELTQELRAVLDSKRWADTSIEVRHDGTDPEQRIVYVPMNAFPVRGER